VEHALDRQDVVQRSRGHRQAAAVPHHQWRVNAQQAAGPAELALVDVEPGQAAAVVAGGDVGQRAAEAAADVQDGAAVGDAGDGHDPLGEGGGGGDVGLGAVVVAGRVVVQAPVQVVPPRRRPAPFQVGEGRVHVGQVDGAHVLRATMR
jgi:hypothetical protein